MRNHQTDAQRKFQPLADSDRRPLKNEGMGSRGGLPDPTEWVDRGEKGKRVFRFQGWASYDILLENSRGTTEHDWAQIQNHSNLPRILRGEKPYSLPDFVRQTGMEIKLPSCPLCDRAMTRNQGS